LGEDDPRRLEMALREATLLAQHGRGWRAALPRRTGLRWSFHSHEEPVFVRGFVEAVSVVHPTAFRMLVPEALRLAPVRHVRIETLRPRTAARLADSPLLGRLAGLYLADVLIADEAV